jgi:hypothetical protein
MRRSRENGVVRVDSAAASLVALALCAGCGGGEHAPPAGRSARAADTVSEPSAFAPRTPPGIDPRVARTPPGINPRVARTPPGINPRVARTPPGIDPRVARTPPGIDPRVALEQGLIPTPIGRGPEFRPAAGAPASGCEPGAVAGRYRAHVEVFGRKQAVVIPGGIGVGANARREFGRVVDADCRAAARTLDPSGVVHFDRDDLRLGDLFAVWGQPLDRARLLSFRGEVSAFVRGRRVSGEPASIALRDGAQIVLESGGYIPPHPSFRFPPRPKP